MISSELDKVDTTCRLCSLRRCRDGGIIKIVPADLHNTISIKGTTNNLKRRKEKGREKEILLLDKWGRSGLIDHIITTSHPRIHTNKTKRRTS
jgi:hypothetical protein